VKRIFVIVAALCFALASGCGRGSDRKQMSVSEEGILNVTEADSLLAPSADEAIELTADNAAADPVTVEVPVLIKEGGLLSQDKPDAGGIQRALKDLGYYQGEIDGKLGPKSKAAIREFQSKTGLAVDGKVGPKTWAALREALENRAVPAEL